DSTATTKQFSLKQVVVGYS
ncbi:hypothetical protein Zm00014a_009254, partial [Zea mays]